MKKIEIIAHRGASGYLPEHTLAAKALAFAMGADYLEQDIVATRDDELVVLHDIHLDRVSDVAQQHPGRARKDGRFYVRDFDLPELRRLHVTERVEADGSPVFAGRFPPAVGEFRVHTLSEEIEFAQGLAASSGRPVGIYPEIKKPAWHRQEGIDIVPQLLAVLQGYGYHSASDSVYLQCFDAAELVRIRNELGSELRLVQLIGENSWQEAPTDYDGLRTARGLQELAETVDAIGPWIEHVFAPGGTQPTELVANAHRAGLKVHPYTYRADSLPAGFENFEQLVRASALAGVDGVFTDFPDRACTIIEKIAVEGKRSQ